MTESNGGIDKFFTELETEYEASQRSLREVELMLDQSQAELSKLTQRNTNATAHLQQIQSHIDTMPRDDIKLAYNSVLDSQQRMLVMRSQLEKLQADQTNLKKRVMLLEQIQNIFSSSSATLPPGKTPQTSGSEMLEMMINSQEAERQRLSRQMHDGPAQALSNFIVQAEIATRLFELDEEKAKKELENLRTSAMTTFQKVRMFIADLRPMMLDDLGLVPTIKRYIDQVREQQGVEISQTIKGIERRYEPFIEVMVFRALQELIGNAIRHNQDQPIKVQITVQIVVDENFIKLMVSDNGKGFDQAEIADGGGLGLKVIRERVEILGGYLDIDSAVGQGSRITVQVPVLTNSTDTEG